MQQLVRRLILVAFVTALALTPQPARGAASFVVQGTLRDIGNNAPLPGVCVSLGPPTFCIAATDANGFFSFEVPPVNTIQYDMYWNKEGYQQGYSGTFTVDGTKTFTSWLFPGPSSCPHGSGTPNTTVYLPNITKTLGGPNGFYTPFIIQNVSAGTITSLHIDLYRFSDGVKIASRDACAVRPGTSYALVPNLMSDLPDSSQFAVVAQSFMAPVVAVVNEQAGVGARAESASYTGATGGATSVFLPNIVRRFFGFHTPFIIQNLGVAQTTATASFVSFDGTKTATIQRVIDPGRSQFVEPNIESQLVDGTQYAVTVTSAQPISVVVNTHNDDASVAAPLVYATNGFAAGYEALQGPYIAKGVPGVGKGSSTVVVQNLGAAAVLPTLAFTPLGGGTATSFTGPSLAAGRSWAFDMRYTNGDTTQPFCGATVGNGCLPDGEYSLVASGPAGSKLASIVNIFSATTGDGYAMLPAATSTVYLPNVTKTLGGTDGWTTPLVMQSVTATTVTVSWYRFSDGTLVRSQSLPITPGTAMRVDPRDLFQLPDNTQFSVVLSGNGTLAAIVLELNFQGGDGAMIYGGFAR
ncbi:MAG TPA: hypothetical protein VGT60_04515 [Candidatus Limnocylindria bacterium]|nr:hypothetical protein [Candidatus Limnocylindria bacterium]